MQEIEHIRSILERFRFGSMLTVIFRVFPVFPMQFYQNFTDVWVFGSFIMLCWIGFYGIFIVLQIAFQLDKFRTLL